MFSESEICEVSHDVIFIIIRSPFLLLAYWTYFQACWLTWPMTDSTRVGQPSVCSFRTEWHGLFHGILREAIKVIQLKIDQITLLLLLLINSTLKLHR